MTRAAIPDDLQRFILTSIGSVPYLEALLLMRRESAQAWGAADLARRLYLPDAKAAALLAALQAAEIALPLRQGEAGRFRYGPSPELAAVLDRVAQQYATNLSGVTDLIHSTVGKRAYDFANAFRWRKDS